MSLTHLESDGDQHAKQREKESKLDTGALYTVNRLHERIGKKNITRQALYLAIQRGEIPSVRIGRRILIPRDHFETMLSGSRIANPAAQ